MRRIPRLETAKNKMQTIGFRLDDESHAVLKERANLYEVSAHKLARQYVLESLSLTEERELMRETITALRTEIKEFRRIFLLATPVLLASAGKVDPKQAEAWVRDNFNT